MTRLSPERQREFEELLAQARAGSREAHQELIEPFEQVLRYRARRRMRRPLQGKISKSDLIQITHLKAFESLDQFHGTSYEEFAGWLLGIMDHAAQDECRVFRSPSRDAFREVPLEEVKEKLVIHATPAEQDQRYPPLQAAWYELPYEYQNVIHLRYSEKCSFDEIGHRLGRSTGAAKQLYYRAKRKLAEDARKREVE